MVRLKSLLFMQRYQIKTFKEHLEQCHEIFDHYFLLKKSNLAPYEQAKMVLQTFSFLQRYSIAKLENRVSLLSTITLTCKFVFRYGGFHIFKFSAIGFVNTPKFLFSPDCSFNSVRSLQRFPKMST